MVSEDQARFWAGEGMADFLFDLAQNFENTFYTQIQRHYDHRQSEWHQRRGSVPGEKEGSITERDDTDS
jgi:hypothetical protein